ncbi:MAG: hypothetical protein GX352_03900 [Clostridiales bacterium]|nr:hypothetical protein [Clostridiales bacterium]
MRWNAVLKDLKGDMGILSLSGSQETVAIPIEYLPKGLKIGDVIRFNISFDPFATLACLNGGQAE